MSQVIPPLFPEPAEAAGKFVNTMFCLRLRPSEPALPNRRRRRCRDQRVPLARIPAQIRQRFEERIVIKFMKPLALKLTQFQCPRGLRCFHHWLSVDLDRRALHRKVTFECIRVATCWKNNLRLNVYYLATALMNSFILSVVELDRFFIVVGDHDLTDSDETVAAGFPIKE